MSARRVCAMFLTCVLGASACRAPATAVVISFDTDAPLARVERILATARWADLPRTDAFVVYPNGRITGALQRPLSYTMLPQSAASEAQRASATTTVLIQLRPAAAGEPAIELRRAVRFVFQPGQTLQARVFLPLACLSSASGCQRQDVPCTVATLCEESGRTCGDDARCVTADVPTSLFDSDGGTGRDATAQDTATSPDVTVDVPGDVAAFADALCTRNCAGRVCGEDGCGGQCGSCPSYANATSSCSSGGERCLLSCNAGFASCDSDEANGCETSLNTAAHCGRCGNACNGATPVCSAGVCMGACSGGQTLCGGGCVSLASDRNHCGACNNGCSLANANTVCNAGNCRVASCNAGFGDCDGNEANGCETSLGTNAHCAACGDACNGATPTCSGGRCVATPCGAGQTRCSGSCVSTDSDVNHCGGCDRACSLPNAAPTCSGGNCAIMGCNLGFGDCDGVAANGCEASLNTTNHCGRCARRCGAGSNCVGGLCVCPGALSNCGGSCVDLTNNADNCGTCGLACAVGQGCCAGMCQAGIGDICGAESCFNRGIRECGGPEGTCVALGSMMGNVPGLACQQGGAWGTCTFGGTCALP
ncbi:MAG: hypothetical protein Q8Q09_07175 [Deltaproteobacteria bacterium]|nr:hypothetical protein [Deltaproteobacteria bacterium]